MTAIQAKNALMTLLGDHRFEMEELVVLLIEKGLIAGADWDERITKRYERGVSPAEWASRCLDPADNQALEDFFT
jgi:hypothetical protein